MPDKKTKFNVAAGERLRLAREALEMPSGEFAERIGISGSRLSNWEAGDNCPQPYELASAKDLYGITLDWVYANDPKGLSKALADKILKPRLISEIPVPAARRKPG